MQNCGTWMVQTRHLHYRFIGIKFRKREIIIIPITKREAKLLEKQGFKYHGFDADLNKTLKSKHYWIADKYGVVNALKQIRNKMYGN